MSARESRRIGIDAHIVGAGKGGVERFLREMCLRLPVLFPQHRFILFCNAQAIADGTMARGRNVELVPLPFSNPLIERALVLPWLTRRHRLDLLFVQRVAPWAMGRCRVALAVHDLTPIKFPAQYRGLTNALIRLTTASSVRRSQVVLTPARAVSREVAALSGEPPEKFHAYYNGVDGTRFHAARDGDEGDAGASTLRQLGLVAPFVFTSGALERRKNVETMMRAMRHVPVELCAQLVVAGGVRDAVYAAELRRIAREEGLEQRVCMVGFVGENELAALYRSAALFVSASRDEGFNMPVLEAMASGVATVCSDIAVHRELFERATRFFPADDAVALGERLSSLLRDPSLRGELIEAGERCTRRFTWDAAARRVGAAFEAA
jgi:glycosyltransferase involved in cell wall biosynthesis